MSEDTTKPEETSLLTRLRELAVQISRVTRVRGAWDILTSAESDDELDVAVDYSIGHALIHARDAAPIRAQHRARIDRRSWTNPIDDLEMIWIPAGPFRVGNQRIEASGFSLARHPVTNAQFARFLKESGYVPDERHNSRTEFVAHWGNTDTPPDSLAHHPVVQVSYIDAVSYCRWAGLNLPTEWLWEKAARGEDGRDFPWGGTTPNPQLTNIGSDETVPVGSYPRTRTVYGCEDMVGNVSEWCVPKRSNYGDLPLALPDVDLGTEELRQVPVRGSCFLRVAKKRMVANHRRELSWMGRNKWVGFRPAFFPHLP